ncbi:UNVERIFIED_CONTAM: hypothetical protein Sindi_2279900 [Sesamum indicum]
MTEAENTTLHIRGGSLPEKKKAGADKRSLYCTHCQRTGHNQSTCFKLHETPDWYKELADKRKKDAGSTRGFTAQVVTERGDLGHTSTKEELLQELITLMRNTIQPLHKET